MDLACNKENVPRVYVFLSICAKAFETVISDKVE